MLGALSTEASTLTTRLGNPRAELQRQLGAFEQNEASGAATFANINKQAQA